MTNSRIPARHPRRPPTRCRSSSTSWKRSRNMPAKQLTCRTSCFAHWPTPRTRAGGRRSTSKTHENTAYRTLLRSCWALLTTSAWRWHTSRRPHWKRERTRCSRTCSTASPLPRPRCSAHSPSLVSTSTTPSVKSSTPTYTRRCFRWTTRPGNQGQSPSSTKQASSSMTESSDLRRSALSRSALSSSHLSNSSRSDGHTVRVRSCSDLEHRCYDLGVLLSPSPCFCL
mmetsp:Transcript_19513/g.33503  ORF Transcript_19513/g.33503 Transcript_19513/m.33503 type:complete len:227 (-) Transcript_19513:199-879(-)